MYLLSNPPSQVEVYNDDADEWDSLKIRLCLEPAHLSSATTELAGEAAIAAYAEAAAPNTGEVAAPIIGGGAAPNTGGGLAAPDTGGGAAAPNTGGGTAAPNTGGGIAAPNTGGDIAAPPAAPELTQHRLVFQLVGGKTASQVYMLSLHTIDPTYQV
jgi:hypothetical protein